MVTDLLLPWLPGLRLDTISTTDTTLALTLTAIRTEAICPLCAHASGHIHSRYTRTVADLPWAGRGCCLSPSWIIPSPVRCLLDGARRPLYPSQATPLVLTSIREAADDDRLVCVR